MPHMRQERFCCRLSTLSAVSALIEQRLGLALTPNRRADYEELLQELARGDLNALIAQLDAAPESAPVWQALIKALAISETYFFRDRGHFSVLRSHILPALIDQRRQARDLTLNVACVGCATGEEPYSIAMLLDELLPDRADWLLHIVGMDINAHALEIARRGLYRPWSFRLNDDDVYRYFDRIENNYQLKPEVRAMVTFQFGNLLDALPVPQYDLILCRNVLLYFSPARAADAESLIHKLLFPGGWLLLGPSEALHEPRGPWITHLHPAAPIYQKAPRPDEAGFRPQQPVMPHAPTRPVITPPAQRRSDTKPFTFSYEAAVTAHQQEDHAATERILAALLQAEPHHARAHVLMAVRYADKRQFEEAHRHLDAALHAEPLLADAYYLRGLLFMETNALLQARQALQNALYCQRGHVLASYTLGTLLMSAGDIPRALKMWKNAREMLNTLPPNTPLTEFSAMTASQLDAVLRAHLTGWA